MKDKEIMEKGTVYEIFAILRGSVYSEVAKVQPIGR
jgi:hypothetical protein